MSTKPKLVTKTGYSLLLKDKTIYDFNKTYYNEEQIIPNQKAESIILHPGYNELEESLRLDSNYAITVSGKVIKFTNSDGSIEVGSRSIASNKIKLIGQFTYYTKETSRNMLNDIFNAYLNCDYLIDNQSQLRLKVSPVANSKIRYEVGARNKMGEFTLEFNVLDPLWESLKQEEFNFLLNANANKEIAINNTGKYKVYPVITLYDAQEDESSHSLQIRNNTNNTFFKIDKTQFGVIKKDMIIDNNIGKIEMNNIDNTFTMIKGSTFIYFNIGINRISLLSNVGCNLTIRYYNRYFL